MAGRDPLTRDRIVTAAIALADARGIDGLSMRKLAAELGYEPMSLYNHVANKDDLLASMVDGVAAEMAVPEGEHWRAVLHRALASARDILLSHPWAAGMWNGVWPGPGRKRWMDGLLGCLRDAGFSVELTHHGYHALDLYVVGTVQQQLSFSVPTDLDDAAATFLEATPEDEYPHLVEHVRYHLDEQTLEQDDFDILLDFMLDGLERRRGATGEAAPHEPPSPRAR